MKKIILPIGILAGVGIIYYFIKKRKPKVGVDQAQGQVSIFDDPAKKPLYDELLQTIAVLSLASEKKFSPSAPESEQITNANMKASKRYDCMSNALRSMSTSEMNALIDFIKNGLPNDIIKFNEYRDIAKKYPLAWSDNPCGYLCTSPDGNTFISGEPCGTKTTPADSTTSSFNGIKGLK
jgi:hypothetical protein